MNIAVADDQVVFATHIVKFDRTRISPENSVFIKSFQKTIDGISCFDEDERRKAESVLGKLDIPFNTEVLTIGQDQIDRVKNKKYTSRSEAIAHLKGEVDEPESEVIPNLKKRQREHDEKIKDYDEKIKDHDDAIKELKELKEVNRALQQQVVTLQTAMATLETRVVAQEAVLAHKGGHINVE